MKQKLWLLDRDGDHLSDAEHHSFAHFVPAQVYVIAHRKGLCGTVIEAHRGGALCPVNCHDRGGDLCNLGHQAARLRALRGEWEGGR